MPSAKSKTESKKVTVMIDVELRGTLSHEMDADEAEKLVDAADKWRGGEVDVSNLPFEVDWDELVNSGEARVDDLYIKANLKPAKTGS